MTIGRHASYDIRSIWRGQRSALPVTAAAQVPISQGRSSGGGYYRTMSTAGQEIEQDREPSL